MTPMGSRGASAMAAGQPSGLLLAQAAQRGGDADHLRRAERLVERVRHPVDAARGLPGDDPHLATGAVDAEAAAVDAARLARVVEDRRRLPGHALHAVVLADAAVVEGEPVGV